MDSYMCGTRREDQTGGEQYDNILSPLWRLSRDWHCGANGSAGGFPEPSLRHVPPTQARPLRPF